MSLLVKALLLTWPFIRLAVFGERKVKDVVVENSHLVVLFLAVVVLAVLSTTLYLDYQAVKSENAILASRLEQVCPAPVDTLLDRQRRLGDLLK